MRAAYCLKVLDGAIAQQQRLGQAAQSQVSQLVDQYRRLSLQRRLSPAEEKDYTALREVASRLAAIKPEVIRAFQTTRARVAAYLMTNYGSLLTSQLSNDLSVLAGSLADANAIKIALQRGEVDVAQCESR